MCAGNIPTHVGIFPACAGRNLVCAGNIPTRVGSMLPAHAGRNKHVQEYFLHMQGEILYVQESFPAYAGNILPACAGSMFPAHVEVQENFNKVMPYFPLLAST